MSETLRVRSRDVAEVESVWRQFIPSASLQRANPATFEFDWLSTGTDGMAVVGYDLTADLESRIDPDAQLIACHVQTRTGRVTGRGVRSGQPWLTIERPVSAQWEGRARVRAFIFDLELAQRTARIITGDDRLVLRATTSAPPTLGAARQWGQTHAYVAASLSSADAQQSPLLAASLRDHALRTTLSLFPTSYTERLERVAQTRPAPLVVRRAVAYIESHLGDPLTVEEIAQAAGISSRGLQAAFRRALDTTPMGYLRAARLDEARRELDASTATVSEVARRWGFSSRSRFAAAYRSAYGHNPRR